MMMMMMLVLPAYTDAIKNVGSVCCTQCEVTV